LIDDFIDGVYFVNLAPIRDPTLLISTIAHTLDIPEAGTQPLLMTVKTALRDKHIFLLLDNFEQIVSAAPLLDDLLASCHQLVMIVTSREVLHIQAEYLFPVPPLVLPDFTELPKAEELAQYAAVALFLQRAQAILPDFQLTEDNAQTLAEICVRLDGLPLALELAAARIRLLPPQALLARLSQRLQVLTGGRRTLPERQQTLRNTIQWSYDLLPAEEQHLFRRLSVFVGGCTLQAVDALHSLLGGRTKSMFEEVASLIDKSLLQQYELEGEPRLQYLETIHEYGLECLDESGEMEAAQQAHAMYYLQLAEEAEPDFGSPKHAAWLKRLEREHDNMRAALRYLLEQGEREQSMELALRLGGALREFWRGHDQIREGMYFLMQAIEHGTEVVSSARAKAFNAAANLAIDLGYLDQGEELAKESQKHYQTLEYARGQALSLHQLQMIARLKGDYRMAQTLAEEALVLFEGTGDRKNAAWSQFRLARLARARGEYARACALFEENVAMHEQLGNKEGMSFALMHWAEALFVSQGDLKMVHTLLDKGIALSRELGLKDGISVYLNCSAQIALSQGDIDTARLLAEEQAALGRGSSDQEELADALMLLGHAAATDHDCAVAQSLYQESLALFRTLGYKVQCASCLEGMASVLAAQGDPAWAARLWGMAESIRETIGSPLPPIFRAEYERAVASARRQLGEHAFSALWAVGRAMTLEQVLERQVPAVMSTSNQVGWLSTHPAQVSASSAGLTVREVEVLRLVAQGLTDAQVAEKLIISPRTVNWHLTSIYSKLQVTSRSAATRYAIEQHLV
jgi:predicted ATPase/DNA-binding CsgD family transcriptional regulator/tetratricopeptide (TPR) repeat protein